jgi:hypothetical protein
MRLDRRTRLTLRLQHTAFFLLLTALCVGLAWFTSRLSWSADWTATGRNSLTAASRRVVRKLRGPVLVLAFAREDPELRGRIRHLVDRYRRVDPKIRLRFVNPDVHLAEVRRLGIRSEGELDLGYGHRHETITTLDQRAFSERSRWSVLVLAGSPATPPGRSQPRDFPGGPAGGSYRVSPTFRRLLPARRAGTGQTGCAQAAIASGCSAFVSLPGSLTWLRGPRLASPTSSRRGVVKLQRKRERERK